MGRTRSMALLISSFRKNAPPRKLGPLSLFLRTGLRILYANELQIVSMVEEAVVRLSGDAGRTTESSLDIRILSMICKSVNRSVTKSFPKFCSSDGSRKGRSTMFGLKSCYKRSGDAHDRCPAFTVPIPKSFET